MARRLVQLRGLGATWFDARLEATVFALTQSMKHAMVSIILGLVAVASPPYPTLAQASDSAYCADLAELALRYAGSPGGSGDTRPDVAIIDAIDSCNKGNTAKGIKVLEEKLRNNGFTLPKRMAPA